MDIILIYRSNGGRYSRDSVVGVMPVIRDMTPGERLLFSIDYREAVRTACSLLRRKEAMDVRCRVICYEDEKMMQVTKCDSYGDCL